MAVNKISLDILTPMGAKQSDLEVPGVEVPGLQGEMGVLPEHVPFVTPLVPGVVRYREGETDRRLAIGAGMLEISEIGRVSILTERALFADEVDSPAVFERLKVVTSTLAEDYGPIDAVEHRKLATEQMWLEAQLRAAAS